jgi:hypothetical protein
MKAENEIWSLSACRTVGNIRVNSSLHVRRKTGTSDGINGEISEDAYRLLLLYANALKEKCHLAFIITRSSWVGETFLLWEEIRAIIVSQFPRYICWVI